MLTVAENRNALCGACLPSSWRTCGSWACTAKFYANRPYLLSLICRSSIVVWQPGGFMILDSLKNRISDMQRLRHRYTYRRKEYGIYSENTWYVVPCAFHFSLNRPPYRGLAARADLLVLRKLRAHLPELLEGTTMPMRIEVDAGVVFGYHLVSLVPTSVLQAVFVGPVSSPKPTCTPSEHPRTLDISPHLGC